MIKSYFFPLRGEWGPVYCECCAKETRIIRLSKSEFDGLLEKRGDKALRCIFENKMGKAVCRNHRNC